MTTQHSESSPPGSAERRVIKRYSNRKLYDTRDSRYVTLLQIAEMVRSGEEVEIIDNATKEDKTDVTLALIISEELKAKPRGIPLPTLKALIRHRGEKLLTQLREGPIGRLMPREAAEAAEVAGPAVPEPAAPEPAAAVAAPPPMTEEPDVTDSKDPPQKSLRATLEQWQHGVDERVRAILPTFSTIRELQAQLERMAARLDELERRLAERERPRE
ncbi:MAG: polyhydroxyalkanoate synthesis regulator DNA-binding domain-containing protein [Polyangiaceae bacterium]|nr:polyhydroxyalkanoate synthesis regulator DNA-binding domain-containing protein [Polyangiaceae bacterium]